MEFTVMTFNLRQDVVHDRDNAWPYRFSQVVRTIERSSALIVSTQEGWHHMLTGLKIHLQQFDYVGHGRLGGTENEHCAIFYDKRKLTVLESDDFMLSEHPSLPGSKSWNTNCPRMCTWARFQFREQPETQFIVYNTHLDHISQEARDNGIRLIWQTICEQSLSTGLPILLTGDMNSTPDNGVIRYLRGLEELNDAYSALPDGILSAGCTYHGFEGGTEGEPIDYIFATNRIEFLHTEIGCGTLDGKYASDHYPVVSRLRTR